MAGIALKGQTDLLSIMVPCHGAYERDGYSSQLVYEVRVYWSGGDDIKDGP